MAGSPKMRREPSRITWRHVLALLTTILILRVSAGAVLLYRDYFPPNFESDFLLGRQPYFWGAYSFAFYVHFLSGPPSLILGLFLLSNRFRAAAPHWHRRLGRTQVANVLLFVVPSGLWMARYAMTGGMAGAGLASLGVATAICCAVGWRLAVRQRFPEHRRWMWRTYVLLCGAVVIRLIGGATTVMHFDALWIYPVACWLGWLAPLFLFEVSHRLPVASILATPVRIDRGR